MCTVTLSKTCVDDSAKIELVCILKFPVFSFKLYRMVFTKGDKHVGCKSIFELEQGINNV